MKSLLLLLGLLSFNLIFAQQDGHPDTTFNEIGSISLDREFQENINDFTFAPDNSILAVGELVDSQNISSGVFIKILENGSIDNSFGNNGKIYTRLNETNTTFNAVKWLDNNKFICSGKRENVFFIALFDSNGNLDENFGNYGFIELNNIFEYGFSEKIHVLSDGSFIIESSYNYTTLFSHITSNGNINVNYGDNGVLQVTSNIVHSEYEVDEIGNIYSLDPDGQVLILNKYSILGVLDSTFGNNGSQEISIESNFSFNAFDYENNKLSFLLFDSSSPNTTNNFKIYQLDTNGELINEFGNNGIASVNLDTIYGINPLNPFEFMMQDDGSFIVIYEYEYEFTSEFIMFRITNDFNMDNQFGSYHPHEELPYGYENQSVVLMNMSDKDRLGGLICSKKKIKLDNLNRIVFGISFDTWGLAWSQYSYPFYVFHRFNNSTLGTNDFTLTENTIKLYPNPAKEMLTIHSENNLNNAIIQVNNAEGKLILATETHHLERSSNGDYQMNISSLDIGLYYLVIHENGKKQSLRFMKK